MVIFGDDIGQATEADQWERNRHCGSALQLSREPH